MGFPSLLCINDLQIAETPACLATANVQSSSYQKGLLEAEKILCVNVYATRAHKLQTASWSGLGADSVCASSGTKTPEGAVVRKSAISAFRSISGMTHPPCERSDCVEDSTAMRGKNRLSPVCLTRRPRCILDCR